MKIVAVNGRRFSLEVLRAAIAASVDPNGQLELLVENAGYFETLAVDYQGGEKYPSLERDPSKPDLLAEIIKPLAYAPPESSGIQSPRCSGLISRSSP